MKALGSHLNYKYCKKALIQYIVVWITTSVVFYLISLWIYYSLYTMDVLVFIFPSYILLNSVFGAVMSIYSFFLYSVKARYRLLNENFRSVLHKNMK